MKKKLATLISIAVTVISLCACASNNVSESNENTINSSSEIENSESKNYETLFNNNNIVISIDTNSITYDKDTKQAKFKFSAINDDFKSFDIGIESVTINNDTDNTNEMYFGEHLGSSIVSDGRKNEFNDKCAIITTNNTIDSIDKLEINFVIYNKDYEVAIITSGATIEYNNEKYTVTKKAVINEEKSIYNTEDDELELLQNKLNKTSLTECNVFGSHSLGYIATDKLKDIRTLSYDSEEYSVADDVMNIKIYKENNIEFDDLCDMIYAECDNLITKANLTTDNYIIDNTTVKIIKVDTEDNYIRYDIILQTDKYAEPIVISMSTHAYGKEKFNKIVTDILKSYTLVDLSSIEL
jgi:hypothetical protein